MANSTKSTSNKPTNKFTNTVTTITPEAREKMVAAKAYELAEQRGFEGNCQLHDWLEAEAKINRIYGKAE